MSKKYEEKDVMEFLRILKMPAACDVFTSLLGSPLAVRANLVEAMGKVFDAEISSRSQKKTEALQEIAGKQQVKSLRRQEDHREVFQATISRSPSV